LKKILLLTSSMESGGAERVAASLANAWTMRGEEVTLMATFSGRGSSAYKLHDSVNLVYLADMVSGRRKSLLNQIGRLSALRRFISAAGPDVIVSFLSNVNVAGVLASALLGTPIVVCERVDPFAMPAAALLRLARRCTYPFADAVMVQTQSVASKLVASGWVLRHLAIIPNPIPTQVCEVQRTLSADGSRCLLGVGRLEEQKQFSLLIRVFASLHHRYPNWKLRIVGEGRLRTDLEAQIAQLGLRERVSLPGRTAAIERELAVADAFVLTSKYEGFPNSLLEAMAAGLPCVAFDCPSGPREISMNGEVAILVPQDDELALADELQRLLSNPYLRNELGDRARASVLGRFAIEIVLAQWDRLFADIGVKT
jgi:glycosyltransferase involved in cell wall biosynthesis